MAQELIKTFLLNLETNANNALKDEKLMPAMYLSCIHGMWSEVASSKKCPFSDETLKNWWVTGYAASALYK